MVETQVGLILQKLTTKISDMLMKHLLELKVTVTTIVLSSLTYMIQDIGIHLILK